jgi:hypothetical protein
MGAKSCRVCWTGVGAGVFSIDDRGPVRPAVVGARYVATAWVRTAPGTAAPPGVQLLLRTITPSPFAEIEVVYSAASTPTATYQQLSISLDVTKNAGAVNVAVVGDLATGACFLVDDVTLSRVR